MTQVYDWRRAPKADFAVIGEEVSHSLSPLMHNAAFKSVGLDYKYLAINVSRGQVWAALDHLREAGYLGVNVTVPHKEEAVGWGLDAVSSQDDLKAVNTISLPMKLAFNTDVGAFRKILIGMYPIKKALLLGAGGSARAVALALQDCGSEIMWWNRTHSTAVEVAESFKNTKVLDQPDPQGCDLIVNATSASKSHQKLPISWGNATASAVAIDLFYQRGDTVFLAEAKSHGLETMDGVKMLVEQGALAWTVWQLPAKPPIDIMENCVRQDLSSNP